MSLDSLNLATKGMVHNSTLASPGSSDENVKSLMRKAANKKKK